MAPRLDPAEPEDTTVSYLAAILDELRMIRGQLVQDPPQDDLSGPQLVSEPAPPPGASR